MHPFWFFFAVLLACIAAYFICGMHIKSRRANTNFKPLGSNSRPDHQQGANAIPAAPRDARR